ncbi:sigma-70 family RNA polymerase sigma factor [Sphingobacterium sp. SGG-5]|uniref:RNA polymerase sigma factor n=1 Tax=Sphingobacterium sp. SGG-5 TaxID=2710881 RepID=UPI0013EAEE95|nr:sigma-70 family RNA polymerase sigma factor [Sphingobacterium sp. SGG-5]NGM61490.1 sigma-70 family RNA polymerase sigma factor [Sphingobacterium sp. SGG-5]
MMESQYALYTLEELWRRIQDDDNRAFDELYARTWKDLYIQTYSKLKIEDLAKDIVQDVFIDIWNKRSIRELQNVKAYLMQAVKFKVLDEFRKARHEFVEIDKFVEEIKASDLADTRVTDNEFFDALHDWIDTLPRKRKEIFHLKYEEGLSNKEISMRLNISQKTVQNQVLNSSSELHRLLRRALFIYLLFQIVFYL